MVLVVVIPSCVFGLTACLIYTKYYRVNRHNVNWVGEGNSKSKEYGALLRGHDYAFYHPLERNYAQLREATQNPFGDKAEWIQRQLGHFNALLLREDNPPETPQDKILFWTYFCPSAQL